MAHHEHLSPEEAKAANIKRIWTVAGVLAGITALEFIIAFTMQAGPPRIAIFIVLTLAKAFYIVADFMHLRHEVKVLIMSILIPTAFVIWLIVALLVEGNSILGVRPH